MRRLSPWLGLAALAVVATCSAPSLGRDEPTVAVDVDAPSALVPRIRAAVLSELGMHLDPVALRRVEVMVEERTLTVSYLGPTGASVRRTVERPEGDDETVETAALLAGNLARDQVGTLLEGLEPAPEPEAMAAPNEKTPEPMLAPQVGAPRSSEAATEPAPGALPLPEPAPDAASAPTFSFAQLSLVWPVAVFPDGQDRSFALDVSALFTRTGALAGVGFYGLGALFHGDEAGVSVAGIATYRQGDLLGLGIAGLAQVSEGRWMRGIAISGLANVDVLHDEGTELRGVEVAGVANAVVEVEGVQIGGVANVAREAEGLQMAGVANVAEEVSGFQLAVAANVARRLDGLQMSAGTNVAELVTGAQLAVGSNHADIVSGLQVSSGVNTAGYVDGLQVGMVNVAKRVSGAQVGLINVAEENDGTAVGLVNIAGNGDIQVATWAAMSSLTNIGAKMRVGPVFVLPAFGYHPLGDGVIRARVGVGAHIPIDPVFLEILPDYAYAYPLQPRDGEAERMGHHEAALTARVGYQVSEMFGFFGGAGVHFDVTQSVEDGSANVRPELAAGVLLF